MSRCLSAPNATSLHHCLKYNKHLKLKAFSGKDPKGVFSTIMHSYFETLGKYLLFTKYLTNMPTAQHKKRAQKKKLLVPHCPHKRGSTV